MFRGQIMSGQDERVPVLFVGPEGCRIAPRNSELRPGEVLVDHGGLELDVRPGDIVRARVELFITEVGSLGPDIVTDLYTTFQGKKYKMVEVDNG